MGIITSEDINYLISLPTVRIKIIIAQMMALMNDYDNKIEMTKNCIWFQRMLKTITNKNRVSKETLILNQDKVNTYIFEVISELYNGNYIEDEMVISLGSQLYDLCENDFRLNKEIDDFVYSISEKLQNVDILRVLIEKMEQGIYSGHMPFVIICKVLSQLDNRILKDERKIEILSKYLYNINVINDEEILISDFLMNIIEIPLDEIGMVYLELSNLKGNFLVDIIVDIIENYHFLPDFTRRLKSKRFVVESIINKHGIESMAIITMFEVYDELLQYKFSSRNDIAFVEDTEEIIKDISDEDTRLNDAVEFFLNCKFASAFELFTDLAAENNGRAMYFMSQFYKYGWGGIKEDKEAAKDWSKLGSEADDVLATLTSIYFIEDSAIREQKFSDIYPSVLELAEQGDVFAQNELIYLNEEGYGTEKDIENAFDWAKLSAENGYWRSMGKLGNMYEDGDGTEQDYKAAVLWYNKAIELGSGDAANNLALLYQDGMGVEVNHTLAFEWFNKAAELGSCYGMYNLACCYRQEIGVKNNSYLSFVWCQKAAEAGHVIAMYETGMNYKYGYNLKDINKDKKEALRWFKAAAELGNGDAQYELGLCYFYGDEIEKDVKIAKEWFEKAVEQDVFLANSMLAQC